MPQSTKTGIGRKLLKIAGIVAGCFLGLLLLATILLLTVLEPIAERFLKKQVVENTEGLYSLDFENIRINLLSGTLVLKEVILVPDSAVHRQQREAGEANPILFELETDRLEISGLNILGALFSKQISIGRVLLAHPQVTLVSDDKAKVEGQQEKPEQESEKVSGLSDFMKSLRIGEIQLQEGTFRHQNLESPGALRHEVPHVSLLILDFRLDSLHQADHTRIMDADDIQVTVKNYQYKSPDSVYQISVGLFSYSLRQGELRADNVFIHSDHEANLALDPEDAIRSIYNIESPRLLVSGLNVVEAYQTKRLQIDHILFENASLDILQNTNIPTESDFPDLADLYKNISAYLQVFEVGALRISNGSLVLRVKIDEITTIHEVKKANVALENIQIDSLTLFSPREEFYADAILASVEEYTFQHPHSPHTVKVKKLELSTRDKYLQADSVRLIGDWDKNEQLKAIGKAAFVVYNLDLPFLRISNFDPIAAYQSPKLDIGRIYLQNPSINMLYDENVEAVDFAVWLQEGYDSMSDYIAKIRVGEISLQHASLIQYTKDVQVRRTQRVEQATLVVTGLEIDSVYIYNLDETVPLEEMLVQAYGYTYWLPDNTYTFKLGSLRYATSTQELTARSVNLISNPLANLRRQRMGKANRSLYDLSATNFRATGLDLIQAYNKNRLVVDQVVLREPELAIFLDYRIPASPAEQPLQDNMKNIFDVFQTIRANSVRMIDGRFTYREKRDEVLRTHVLEQASATITGLALSSQKISDLKESLPMQEMVLTARDYTYQSPDGLYTFTLDSLHYSSRQQELIARSMELRSDKEANEQLKRQPGEQANRNLFDISARKFRIGGFDILEAYETGQFIMEGMVLTAPEVAILQDKNVPERPAREAELANGEAMEQVAELIDAFRVGRIEVNEGTFTLQVLTDTIMTAHNLERVSVAIERFRLVDLEANDPLDMFEAEEIGVLVQDYRYILPDSLYALGVKEIRTTLRDPTLTIDSLRLVPLFKKEEYADRLQYAADRFDILVPGIQLQDINMRALFNNQDLIISRVQITDGQVDIYRDNRVQQDPDRRPKTLQNMLRRVENYVKIDTIAIENAQITYSEIPPAGNEPAVLALNDIQMEISNVTNDSLLILHNPRTVIHASTQLMGASKLQVDFIFQLDHPEDLYTYEGTLDPMDFKSFNPLFEKMMFVRMEDGQINHIEFSVKATAHLAEGQMRFYYNDLEVRLIDKDNPENPGFVRRAGTWLINTFVIKANNPTRRGKFRKGDIGVDRDYEKSVFNHMSSAMMSGLISSLMPPLVERIVETLVGDL
jgi:hypothetical protein